MSEPHVAGVDEVGRGALAGPVICAAVILDTGIQINGLTDSKRLSSTKRENVAEKIKETCLCWSIGIGTVEEIDRENILKATLIAMKHAVESLRITPDQVLVDGNQLPNLNIPAQAIVKGDLHVPAISAASILAKVTRDRLMHEYAIEYPQYGFESNVGYGTARHLEALQEYGATTIHRSSFAPVRDIIMRDNPGNLP